MGSPGSSQRPSRSTWLTRFVAVTLLLLVALGITHIPTNTSAQSSILVTTRDGGPGPIVASVDSTVAFMVSGLVPGVEFEASAWRDGECLTGTQLGSSETYRADANGNWSEGSVWTNVTQTWGIVATQGANVSNCFVVTWANPTPTPTPSPTPEPLVMTINGGPGPVTGTAGGTAVLGVTGLTPLEGFELHFTNGPTCTASYTPLYFTGVPRSSENITVGTFAPNQSYSYLAVQGGRTSNCVTISVPPEPTATNTPPPTATSTPEPTATPVPLVMTVNGGPGTVTGTSGGTANLGISGLTPLEDFELRFTNGPTCTASFSPLQQAGVPSSSTTITIGPFAPNQSYSYLAVQGGRSSNCVTITIPPDLTMTSNGSLGPIEVPVRTSVPLYASGAPANTQIRLVIFRDSSCQSMIGDAHKISDANGEADFGIIGLGSPNTWSFQLRYEGFFSNCLVVTWFAPTATPEPPTPTATPEPTATNTPEPTATNTPEPTATNTPEPTATSTPEPTATSTPEPTATATNTPVPTSTSTPVATATNTPQPIATSTPSPTSTATGGQGTIPSPSPSPTVPITELPNTGSGSNPTALAVGMMLAFAIAFGLFALIANGRRRRS